MSLRICVIHGKLTLDVKGILHFSSGMLLRYKHGVEIPECTLDESVGRHLGESTVSETTHGRNDSPHVKENLSKLFPHFEKRM